MCQPDRTLSDLSDGAWCVFHCARQSLIVESIVHRSRMLKLERFLAQQITPKHPK